MNHPLVSIPLHEGRRQNDPCHRNNYSFVGLVPMQEAKKFAPITAGGQTPWVNPRLFDPDPLANKNKMARTILLSAKEPENFGRFHLLNRGITLVAENATLDSGTFKIDFGASSKMRGLLDGGTTVSALVAALNENFEPSKIEDDEKQQFINLRVFCGPHTEDEIIELSEALNKGRQVNDFALANLDGQFEWIKQALKSETNGYRISYATNEDGDIGIDDVIQWMSLLVLDKPSIAYASQNACLKRYQDEGTDNDDSVPLRQKYENLRSVLPDIIKLSEYVPCRAKERYQGNFLLLAMIKESSKGKYRLPISGKEISFTPHNAWVFPMLSSLRANLDTTKTPYKWKVDDVFAVFDKAANTLVKQTNDNFDGRGTMATLGKNSALYELLKSKVEVEVERMLNSKGRGA